MPLQNRVTPWSEIVIDAGRGLFMGNRGRLHDHEQRLLVRPVTRRNDWTLPRWIICRLSFGERRRVLMSPDSYTELFFLDEATALAAGHRPCAECMRAEERAFASAWKTGNPTAAATGATAAARDRILHEDRRSADRSQRTHRALAAELPDGAMIDIEGTAELVLRGAMRPWSFAGYGAPRPLPDAEVTVLTPSTTVAALRAGYRPVIHPTGIAAL